MKLLLDTQLLLWAATQPGKLSTAARKLLEDERNELHFSAASIWEVAIKRSLARTDFQIDPRLRRRALLDNGYHELPIASAHAVAVDNSPPIHKDPFDRILVAQSTNNNPPHGCCALSAGIAIGLQIARSETGRDHGDTRNESP